MAVIFKDGFAYITHTTWREMRYFCRKLKEAGFYLYTVKARDEFDGFKQTFTLNLKKINDPLPPNPNPGKLVFVDVDKLT